MKKNFKIDQRVVIVKTTSPELDNVVTGFIAGKSHEHVTDTYIVILDKPLEYNGWKAISMTEACLEPLEV